MARACGCTAGPFPACAGVCRWSRPCVGVAAPRAASACITSRSESTHTDCEVPDPGFCKPSGACSDITQSSATNSGSQACEPDHRLLLFESTPKIYLSSLGKRERDAASFERARWSAAAAVGGLLARVLARLRVSRAGPQADGYAFELSKPARPLQQLRHGHEARDQDQLRKVHQVRRQPSWLHPVHQHAHHAHAKVHLR